MEISLQGQCPCMHCRYLSVSAICKLTGVTRRKIKMKTMLLLLWLLNWAYADVDVECPMNLDYVRQLPWDKSSCQSAIIKSDCCQTLRGLLGIGLAQYLRDASMFELPSLASTLSCHGLYQQQLHSLALSRDLVAICFNNITLVSSPVLCSGIQSKEDWIQKLGITPMDSACRGDLSDLEAYYECNDSQKLVHKMLVDRCRNLTEATSLKCYYFTLLYAAGVVNEFGPKSRSTAQCIFGLPFVQTASHGRVLAYSFIGTAAVLLLIYAVVILYSLRQTRIDRNTVLRKRFMRGYGNLMNSAVRPNNGAVWFGIEEIRDATDNFCDANIIGQGGFSTVYRGTLMDSQPIAVKRIINSTAEGDSEFLNEVEIINNLRHRNLVVLRSCCMASDEGEEYQQFLIYDYMPNGSLDEHLFGEKSKSRPLSWSQRRNIIMGTAKGLAYLHDGVESAIYHRDIKATNILLDEEMNTRVADEEIFHFTNRVVGTHGYMVPEYALYGQLTDKNDVYSFGVLLLEIMSGRKALDASAESAFSHRLGMDAGATWEDQRDNRRESARERGRKCDGEICMVAFRPRMVEAVKMLEGETEIPEIPDRSLPLLLHGPSLAVPS